MARSGLSWILEGVAIVGIVGALAIALLAWPHLPATIPIHFGLDGRPNGWGPKGFIGLMPTLGVGLYSFLTILRRYPHTFNYPVPITATNAPRQYEIAVTLIDWLKAEFGVETAFITWMMTQSAQAGDLAAGLWFLLAIVGAIFVTIGLSLRQTWLAKE